MTNRPLQPADRAWVDQSAESLWGAPVVVSRGHVYRLADLPGFVADAQGEPVGLATYRVDGRACELVSLNSLREGLGVGSALVDAVRAAATEAGCARLWLITTNDNLHALRWYQRHGFVLAALYPNALAESRRLKPQIPLIGNDGIPLRDEIELERVISDEG